MATEDRSQRAELGALAPARQRVYSFLGDAFSSPPSAERLAAVRAEEFLRAAAGLFGEEVLAPLREYAKAAQETAESQRQAQQEFMDLFKVPGARYVMPYESVFRDTREVAGQEVKGLLMGPAAVDVQKWYRLAALEISGEYKDLPDHICLELSYLAHLCVKEQEFASAGAEAKLTRAWQMQRDFLAAHIVPWIGNLRDKIREKSQHPFYRAVADMAVEFTKRDLATLEGLLGPSQGTSAPEYGEIGS